MLKTAFIGLGSQGGPMAERMLTAGYSLTVWARRPEALQSYVDKGAAAAATLSPSHAMPTISASAWWMTPGSRKSVTRSFLRCVQVAC